MITPCTCPVVPVRSSRESAGAELVHETDARGEWHAVRAGGVVYRQALVTPSALELESAATVRARAAAEEAARPLDRVAALALVVRELRGGAAAPAEAHAIAATIATEAAAK